MHRFFSRFSFALSILVLVSCALPVPIGSELNGFVPERELTVVSLAREGMQLFNNSRFFEAEARFRKALYLEPSLNNIRFNLATTLERTGLFEEAEQVYRQLILSEGEKAIYRAAYGRLLISKSDYIGGKKEFLRARTIAEIENDQPMFNSLSQSLVTLELGVGNLEMAVCEAKALVISTKNVDHMRQYVRLLLSAGRSTEAASYLENSATEITPDDSIPSLYLRTLTLFAVKKDEEALEFSERVLSTPNLEPAIDFDLRVINLVLRYFNNEKNIFEDEKNLGFLKILNEAVESSPLASIYWSPRLLSAVHQMLGDPEVVALVSE